jgi:anti-sigma-K factor RskA
MSDPRSQRPGDEGPRDMASADGHERWLEAAAGFALDALEPAERADFEQHLTGCATCRLAVQEFREVTGLLMHASEPVAPPAGLQGRVGKLLEQERAAGAATNVTPTPPAPSTPVIPLPTRAPGGAWRGAALWLAAAGIAFAVVSAVLWQRVNDERALVRTAALELQQLRSSQDSLLQSLQGPRVQVASLSAPAGGAPVVRVFWNQEINNYVLTAFRLPPAQAGRVYQLWAIAAGRDPISMGTFTTDANGDATQVIPVSPAILALGDVQLCALTEEPAGGSPGPTETPRLVGEWRSTN